MEILQNFKTFDFQNQVGAEVEAHQAIRGDVPQWVQVFFVRGNTESAPCHDNTTVRLQAAVFHQLEEKTKNSVLIHAAHCYPTLDLREPLDLVKFLKVFCLLSRMLFQT